MCVYRCSDWDKINTTIWIQFVGCITPSESAHTMYSMHAQYASPFPSQEQMVTH